MKNSAGGQADLRVDNQGAPALSLVLLVVWLMRAYYLKVQVDAPLPEGARAAALPTVTPTVETPDMPEFPAPQEPQYQSFPAIAS